MKKVSFTLTVFLFTVSVIGQTFKEGVKSNIKSENGAYKLYFNNQPYFIKGANFGGKGNNNLLFLSTKGANSIRLPINENFDKLLNEAFKQKLTVLVDLPVKSEFINSFNYDDTAQVHKQFNEIKNIVSKYKNHPYILFWNIGNELSINYKNKNVWKAVNNIAKTIHKISPNQITMTVISENPINAEVINEIKNTCPEIDVLGINQFGNLESLASDLNKNGWEKPYIITEWGATGHNQTARNKWDIPIEETSTEKARVYKSNYEKAILKDKEKCLGAYVYYWGQKQDRTSTWYGMFLESGQQLEAIDIMEFLWKNKWPVLIAPGIDSIRINDKKPETSIELSPNTKHEAEFIFVQNKNLSYRLEWHMFPEPDKFSNNHGQGEVKPQETIVQFVKVKSNNRIVFTAPEKEGNYRLFVTIFGEQNKAAVANIPFHVRSKN
jgi:hypothetical protein